MSHAIIMSLSKPTAVKPWGLWATLSLSFCVWVAFVAVQTLVFFTAVVVYLGQNPELALEDAVQILARNGLVLAIATMISTPVCMGLIALFIKLRRRGTIADYLQLRLPARPIWRSLSLWSLITVGFIYGIDWLKSLIRASEASTFTLDVYETAHFLPLLYVAIVIAAPLFEEVFFRGFMFQGLLHSRVGAIGAIVINSLIWAVIHSQYDTYDVGGIFLFGMVLSVAQLITKSLVIPILMHSLNNFLALLITGLSP